ncbi:MAG: OmpA family protein [Deltaproteobacteria bacterium]|nr:OmpA family protein [Deltaproteobacteria bacterium]
MSKRMIRGIVALVVLAFLAVGCASGGKYEKTGKGAAVGAGTGAVLGAIIGSTQGEMGKGAVIGAAAGAAVGTAVGYNMDKQAKELAQIPNTQVEQTAPDRIVVTMKDSILFATNSSTLVPASQATLKQIAEVMVKYPDTSMIVKGHTDSVGSDDYNLKLSESRAGVVKNFLIGEGVVAGRITSIGYGESVPVADNNTEAGRASNRRVEIEVKPSPAQG